MVLLQFSIKIIGVYFVNSVVDSNNWEKLLLKINKKNHIWDRVQLFSEGKNNHKPNPFTKTMVHWSNIHYSIIY